MTDKQIVEDLLYYFNKHPGYIDTGNGIYKYKKIRRAIMNCLKQAMEDGYKKGHLEAEAAALYDVTIGGHKDW